MAELARLQHGVVSRDQLVALGLGRGAIDGRRARGSLHAVHRAVYAVGHTRLTWRGQLWAAALAKDAVPSHRSGGAVWDLHPQRLPIEMTTTRGARSSPGIVVHRSRTLRPEDITTVEGLPVTTVARTIVDLLDVLPTDRIPGLLKRADFHGILDFGRLSTAPPGRRSRALKGAVEEVPLVNDPLLGYTADFVWPDHALVVETDGAAAHFTLAAFEDDRRRDAAFLLAGYRVVRFTYRQVTGSPDEVASTLAALLALDFGRPWWGSRAVKGDGL